MQIYYYQTEDLNPEITWTSTCSCAAINCHCLGNTEMKYEDMYEHAIQENKELKIQIEHKNKIINKLEELYLEQLKAHV